MARTTTRHCSVISPDHASMPAQRPQCFINDARRIRHHTSATSCVKSPDHASTATTGVYQALSTVEFESGCNFICRLRGADGWSVCRSVWRTVLLAKAGSGRCSIDRIVLSSPPRSRTVADCLDPGLIVERLILVNLPGCEAYRVRSKRKDVFNCMRVSLQTPNGKVIA